MRELSMEEMGDVAGGLSIREMIEEAFPFGEWVGNSYYPNGVPSAPPSMTSGHF